MSSSVITAKTRKTRSFWFVTFPGKAEIPVSISKGVGKKGRTEAEAIAQAEKIQAGRDLLKTAGF